MKSPRSRAELIKEIQKKAVDEGRPVPNMDPNRKIKGEFDTADMVKDIVDELKTGENVVVDTCKMDPAQINALRSEVAAKDLDPRQIIFYP